MRWAASIKRGDRVAFRSLFRTYVKPLCTFAEQYTRSPEIAEELVQDLFFKIWKERARWSPAVSVKSYLYTAARNLALDYLKHERVVETWKQEAIQEDTATQLPPDKRFHRKQLQQAVREAVDELPERCRQVFRLSRHHGLTYREIAAVLDISPKTVETHMRRGFRLLRMRLAPYDSTEASTKKNG